MKEIRETIVEENEMCGFENPNLVNVESDARYNNPIYNSGLYSVSFPITASSAKFAVQCPLWLGHFTTIPLFRSLDATLQSLCVQGQTITVKHRDNPNVLDYFPLCLQQIKNTPFKHSLSMETIDIQCFIYYSVIGDPFIYRVVSVLDRHVFGSSRFLGTRDKNHLASKK
jgi:hypothetical protein